MKARLVKENIKDFFEDQDVSYEEVIEFAKDSFNQYEKIYGPAVNQGMKGNWYVEHGGITRLYDNLKDLLHAIEVVQDNDTNVIWNINKAGRLRTIPVISFDSDEERKTGEEIRKYYISKSSGGYTGD